MYRLWIRRKRTVRVAVELQIATELRVAIELRVAVEYRVTVERRFDVAHRQNHVLVAIYTLLIKSKDEWLIISINCTTARASRICLKFYTVRYIAKNSLMAFDKNMLVVAIRFLLIAVKMFLMHFGMNQ